MEFSTRGGQGMPARPTNLFSRQKWLAMRLMLTLLFTSLLQAQAHNGWSQNTVTLSFRNALLPEVFKAIQKQTGYSFAYERSVMQQAKRVSIAVINVPLREALDSLFREQPFGYEVEGRMVILRERIGKENKSVENIALVNKIDVKGLVLDEKGTPLPGASIVVKGSNKGTITNELGEFALINVDPNAVIIITSIGYNKEEVPLAGKATIQIRLKEAIGNLDELQIIAYGKTSRRLNTGSVSTISAAEIERQPVNNPLLALQGRLPGVLIVQNTGVPGGSVNIQIRGVNSLENGNDPLYVVDGIPYPSQLLRNLGGNILQQTAGNVGAGSPLSFINSSDIESISVLKDADATAIYGSRGANGVVLITTKKGKAGTSQININLASGYGKVARRPHLLNTQQYILMRREAFKNDGVIPTTANAPDLLVWDTTMYTDWQKELIGGTATYLRSQASVSGGNANFQYLVSGTYSKETTVFPDEFADQKGAVHFNFFNSLLDGKLKFNFSGNYIASNNKIPNLDLASYVNIAPNAPNPYNSDGSLNWANSTWTNPLSALKRLYKARNNNLVSNIVVSYKVIKGLELSGSFGYTNLHVNEISTSPIAALNPNSTTIVGSSSFTNNNIRSWIFEPQLSYQVPIGYHKLEALVGATFLENKNEGYIIDASGYTSDALLENIQAGPTRTIRDVTYNSYKYNAVFGRATYIMWDRYILNLTVRRDGSSRFGNNNKFHNFGSLGLAWIFGGETFIKKLVPFLSFGKLRTSYGTTGNDQIDNYRFYDLYNTTSNTYQGIVGLTPSRLYNPNLQWEETKKIEFALDLGFIEDRILINTNFYINRSSNQLLTYLLPATTGFGAITANFPATVQNWGWEFTLQTNNINSKSFSWSSSVNITIPRNKLVSFPDFEKSSYSSLLVIGHPIGITKAYAMVGVNDTAGIYQFADGKGIPTFTPSSASDRIAIINQSPKYYGGIGNNFRFKGFQLGVFIQFVKQLGNHYLFNEVIPPGYFNNNSYPEVLRRWQKPGDKSPIQQFTQNTNSTAGRTYRSYARQSNFAYVDASFIRLKNIYLSYKLSSLLVKKSHLNECEIYAQAQNVSTISNYKGADPENQNINVLPPLRVITLGIKIAFR